MENWDRIVLPSINQIILHRKKHQSRRILRAKPFHQPVLNRFHRAGTHFQLLRNLRRSKLHTDILDHIPFPVTHRNLCIKVRNHLRPRMRFLEQNPVYEVIQVKALAGDLHNRAFDLGRVGAFEQVAVDADFHHMTHERLVFIHGENGDMDLGIKLGDEFGGFDAVLEGIRRSIRITSGWETGRPSSSSWPFSAFCTNLMLLKVRRERITLSRKSYGIPNIDKDQGISLALEKKRLKKLNKWKLNVKIFSVDGGATTEQVIQVKTFHQLSGDSVLINFKHSQLQSSSLVNDT